MNTTVRFSLFNTFILDCKIYDFDSNCPELELVDIEWKDGIPNWDRKQWICDYASIDIDNVNCEHIDEDTLDSVPKELADYIWRTSKNTIEEAAYHAAEFYAES